MVGEKIVDFLINKNGGLKLNLAFIPYCFKMWDSMSSVYESANKRGLGTAVFPIPYFSLKDGKIDEWHHDYLSFTNVVDEDDLYDFNDFYKLSNEIDYVIIHNAYDDGNTLTTIHPFFYSDMLKAFGLKIIFIPYGIPYGGVSYDLMRLQKGALNADYIFVNCKEEREGFIESWKKVGVDMTDRCLAFGSPKTDGLFKEYKMPPEWQIKILRPVTMICTSILPFMKDPERKLKEYRWHIENELSKGNMVIFRPHPLMDETVKQRCPELWNDWIGLLEFADENAIDDYGHELTESMYFSQKLISDVSSVIEIWKLTGKQLEIMD